MQEVRVDGIGPIPSTWTLLVWPWPRPSWLLCLRSNMPYLQALATGGVSEGRGFLLRTRISLSLEWLIVLWKQAATGAALIEVIFRIPKKYRPMDIDVVITTAVRNPCTLYK